MVDRRGRKHWMRWVPVEPKDVLVVLMTIQEPWRLPASDQIATPPYSEVAARLLPSCDQPT
jgi:hypothetical protein